ncbi:NADH dehydrogenase [ubiquinone] 1 alpha subcomplex assembly factor 3 [Venturia canescens]|uniref:NADH dehydrogenase [ubiquinone] 1 alpha subcomplex assembly factor 3 n=1 Tax=Venturia canescens TaxID=32260 RepID=UPI001C9BF993|nr:NADH dehydrogenase [ubiquinone] 1 alpha subcomplex assembly factor 3 [Venturia canescens]
MKSFLPRLIGVGSVKLIRSFHRSCVPRHLGSRSYDGDGKTTVSILNTDLNYGLMIDGLSSSGFKLNNGVWVLGPVIIFPKSIISWNIGSSEDINEESLVLFKILQPKLDILILGLDQKYENSVPFIQTVKTLGKKIGMNIEICQTVHACTTFNYLNAERRYVAAALMPPRIQLPRGIKALQDTAMRRRLAIAEEQISAK